MKRKPSVLCIVVLLMWVFSLSVLAEDSVGGSCGDGVSWVLTGTTLTISGSGAMADFDYSEPVPWSGYENAIVHLVVEEGVTAIGDRAFSRCEKLLDVSLPESVTGIGDNAFYYCDVLGELTLPNGLTELGSGAFEQCRMLRSMTIPQGVTVIPDSAFYGCSLLAQVELHDGITTIGSSAFHGCSSLSAISIPAGATDVAPGAFASCSSLTELTVDAGNENYVFEGGALYNAEKTLLVQGCCAAEVLELPDTLTEIGDYSLYGCHKLSRIRVPDGVKCIGAGAFGGCDNLSYMVIPASVETLGYGALENGTLLGFSGNTTDIYYGGDEVYWNVLMEQSLTDTEGVTVHFGTTEPPEEPVEGSSPESVGEQINVTPETVEEPEEASENGFVIPVLIGAAVAILGLGTAAVVLRKKHTKTGV